MLTGFDKAIMGFVSSAVMPAITATVMNALGMFGITGGMTIKDVVASLLTGFLVYLWPNKKKIA